MSEWIGWVATAIFAASYFLKDPVGLRRLQALAASLWIAYGVFIAAPPVIVANVIVAVMAVASSWKQKAPPAREDPRTLGDA
jgi:hypothetical protein